MWDRRGYVECRTVELIKYFFYLTVLHTVKNVGPSLAWNITATVLHCTQMEHHSDGPTLYRDVGPSLPRCASYGRVMTLRSQRRSYIVQKWNITATVLHFVHAVVVRFSPWHRRSHIVKKCGTVTPVGDLSARPSYISWDVLNNVGPSALREM